MDDGKYDVISGDYSGVADFGCICADGFFGDTCDTTSSTVAPTRGSDGSGDASDDDGDGTSISGDGSGDSISGDGSGDSIGDGSGGDGSGDDDSGDGISGNDDSGDGISGDDVSGDGSGDDGNGGSIDSSSNSGSGSVGSSTAPPTPSPTPSSRFGALNPGIGDVETENAKFHIDDAGRADSKQSAIAEQPAILAAAIGTIAVAVVIMASVLNRRRRRRPAVVDLEWFEDIEV